ncbi:hypothetical protein PLESTB_001182500 [Pleodorina starrii]|uniref:Nucleotide-diphospho-sugar transferase domain-containing protein n=1 Tax=Pleodorina starrii TaxID=330485 RepID=A0A9W6F636_9CHLO|nr:hypothetical protein PLESTM_000258500 [Pleodorina starrii]GLC57091.1 hypothetical protein PLESTB_001182500 [Pleodorina starrii]GLC64927.1 hypothetical protein PLESTF_000222900 [Pleodorina starrii]
MDARSYKNIGWAKVKLTRDVLKLGYNVHLSDLDISYLKPIHLARKEVFSWSRGAADGSMMQEEWVHQDDPDKPATRRPIYIANTGVVFLRANSRTVGFMESLLKYEGADTQDQYVATLVAYASWAPCVDEASCLAARKRGLAAVQLHPAQFAGSNCLPEQGYSPCATRRLYVHAVCRVTSVTKEAFLRYTKAMFIGGGGGGGGGSAASVDASQAPAWLDPLVLGQQDNAAIAASGLPCPPSQQRAWSGWMDAVNGVGGGGGAGAATKAPGGEDKAGAKEKKVVRHRKLVGS